jgi:hypothetical protein
MICKTLHRKLNDFTRALESKDTHDYIVLFGSSNNNIPSVGFHYLLFRHLKLSLQFNTIAKYNEKKDNSFFFIPWVGVGAMMKIRNKNTGLDFKQK